MTVGLFTRGPRGVFKWWGSERGGRGKRGNGRVASRREAAAAAIKTYTCAPAGVCVLREWTAWDVLGWRVVDPTRKQKSMMAMRMGVLERKTMKVSTLAYCSVLTLV